jgi:hypothetical protein
VPRTSARDLVAKLVERQACPDPLLQARAALSRIYHACDGYTPDIDTRRCQKQWQHIHNESGIHPCAEHSHTTAQRKLVHLRGGSCIPCVRIHQLLTRRDHIRARLNTLEDLRVDGVE